MTTIDPTSIDRAREALATAVERREAGQRRNCNQEIAALDAVTPGFARSVSLLLDALPLFGHDHPVLVDLLDRHRRDVVSIDEIIVELEILLNQHAT